MSKITVTNDPTLYLRNSGLKHPGFNMLNASFTSGKNKEHKRPVHVSSIPAKKVMK